MLKGEAEMTKHLTLDDRIIIESMLVEKSLSVPSQEN